MGKTEMLESAVLYMEHIAACPEHGYSQSDRMGQDYDCSSLVCRALAWAGFGIKPNLSTHTMLDALKKIGFAEYKTGNRKRGDILLTPAHHVAVCTDARKIVHAVADERGKASGGKPGDQTGKEILVQDWYDRAGGWKYRLRLYETVPSDVTAIAKLVIAGKYGNGAERRARLMQEGFDPAEVQAEVNRLLKAGY